MAESNGIGFLGRVPIDTVLVGLLDAASKGEVEATGLAEQLNGTDSVGLENGEARSFPLLDRYIETTSSKVWRGIAEGVIEGIGRRKADIASTLEPTA